MKVGYSAGTAGMVRAQSQGARRFNPALAWSLVGAAMLAFEFFVLARWISGPYFTPTDPGPDPIPARTLYIIRTMEVVFTTALLLIYWFLVINPWRRDGKPSLDGLLVLAWTNLLFQDPFLNYTSTQYLINSHAFNFGSWTMGSFPSWVSPKGNQLPEPLFLWVGGYASFGFLPAIAACWAMRRYKEKFPRAGVFELVLAAFAATFVIDMVGESLMIRGGIYAYPGHIDEITLWAGETYQFPLNESFFMGAVMAASGCLRYFVNDRGETFVERGLERLSSGKAARQWLRFLAVFGYVHLSMWVLYNIPQQWVGMHTDAYPKGYPSYMLNGMCAYGVDGKQCPGPGVAIPRP